MVDIKANVSGIKKQGIHESEFIPDILENHHIKKATFFKQVSSDNSLENNPLISDNYIS